MSGPPPGAGKNKQESTGLSVLYGNISTSPVKELLYNLPMPPGQQTSPAPAKTRILSFILLSCLLLGVAGCRLSVEHPGWTMNDLRLIDPVDASEPQVDIIALYTRTRALALEIRIDMLDILPEVGYDLRLLFSTKDEDLTVQIPSVGKPSVTNWKVSLFMKVERDPEMDTVIIVLNRLFLPDLLSLQAFSYLPTQAIPSDQTEITHLDGSQTLGFAPVLFVFWDVFPAATPAQALRRWDGAHTGPFGGRHGLHHLLDAVEKYELPVTLLDLLNQPSLAALAFTDGALQQVQRLSTAGLLSLPVATCGQPPDIAEIFSRQAAMDFKLPVSSIVYPCGAGVPLGYKYTFYPLDDTNHLRSTGDTTLIPLSSPAEDQSVTGSLPLSVRRRLVETAISLDPADLVILGGSLPDSSWGASEQAESGMAWLASHPWVKVLGYQDLHSFPVAMESDSPDVISPSIDPWLVAMRQAPDNLVTNLAWQAMLMLTTPFKGVELLPLREAYGGQMGILLAAASWAESPSSRMDCSSDPDRDGQDECLLTSESVFSVIEIDGARLTHLFLLDEGELHQVVAPTSQFTLGLSDTSLWQPELGDGADPGAVMGAFSDTDATYAEYQPRPNKDELVLMGEKHIKTFRLLNDGIQVSYQSALPVSLQIPLAVDPQVFFTGKGYFNSTISPGFWIWGPEGGFQVEVHTEADLSAEGFTVSLELLEIPEDPDREYPLMHYFPFPFSLVTIDGEGEFSVSIVKK